MNTTRKVIVKHAIALLLLVLALAPPLAAAAELRLPQGWTESITDGIRSYRSPDDRQSLTIGLYELDPAITGDAQLVQLLHKSMGIRRAAERELGATLLSPISLKRSAGLVLVRYSGEALNRRFVNVTVTCGRWLQNFYYEAIGLAARDFERASREILLYRPRGQAKNESEHDAATSRSVPRARQSDECA